MILNYYNYGVSQPTEIFLHKDFGQVATVLGALHGQAVTHLGCCREPNAALDRFAGNEVVQIRKRCSFLPGRLDFLQNGGVYRFLRRRRGAFSVLVLFPICPPSDFVVAWLFRALNPGARIVVKLDANLAHLERLQASYRAAPGNRLRQHHYYGRLLDIADVVIYESRRVGSLLTQGGFLGRSPQDARKFVNVFNGLSERQLRAVATPVRAPADRERVIVFSGRLSAPEKNVELIFRSDPVPPGWRLRFIGPVGDAFRARIDSYRQRDPDFDRKYEFVGEIRDKATYFRELARGRILLLCSVKEGFPMVYAEALLFGLFIVTTDVGGAAEATDGGRLGVVIPPDDPRALRDALHAACTNPALDETAEAARAYGARHFVWERSLRTPALDALFESTRRGEAATLPAHRDGP